VIAGGRVPIIDELKTARQYVASQRHDSCRFCCLQVLAPRARAGGAPVDAGSTVIDGIDAHRSHQRHASARLNQRPIAATINAALSSCIERFVDTAA
jgi:hypothetical protein